MARAEVPDIQKDFRSELAEELASFAPETERQATIFERGAQVMNQIDRDAAHVLEAGERFREGLIEPDYPENRILGRRPFRGDQDWDNKFNKIQWSIVTAARNSKRTMVNLLATSPDLSGAPFVAKDELQKIKEAPTKERRTMLVEFKRKLARQQEAAAHLQADLRGLIDRFPDAGFVRLFDEFKKEAKAIGLGPDDVHKGRDALLEYSRRHAAIRKYRDKYPDDAEFVEAMFGRKLKGEVVIEEGPMTLFVRFLDPNDYTGLMHSLEGEGRDFTRTAAVAIPECHIPELRNIVTLENAHGARELRAESLRLFVHEEQHAFSTILHPEERKRTFEGDTTNRDHLFLSHAKEYRDIVEMEAQGEILAHLISGEPLKNIFNNLTLTKNLNGMYDYFAERVHEKVKQTFGGLTQRGEEYLERMFRHEYRELMRDALYACDRLEHLHGKSREEIVALLQHTHIDQWKKLVDRLSKEKEL